jgi:hypothetical protein
MISGGVAKRGSRWYSDEVRYGNRLRRLSVVLLQMNEGNVGGRLT